MTETRRPWIAYTDGACSGNPGPGGWGAILLSPEGDVRELGGPAERTTNNRMELSAAVAALEAAPPGEALDLYTDSTYLIQGVTSWVSGWKRRGWTTKEGGAVLNRDLWERLDALVCARRPAARWHYVRGHSGAPGNERCDEIAVAWSQGEAPTLYAGPVDGYTVALLPPLPQGPLPRSAPGERSSSNKGPALYLSLVDGRLERHDSWPECQARVVGRSNARFKKVRSKEEEDAVLKAWGLA